MRGGGEGGHTCHVDGDGQGVGVGTHLHPHPVARGGQRQRGQGEGMSMQVQEGDKTEGSFEKVIGNVVLNKWGLRGIGASSWDALVAAAGPVEVDRDEVDCTKQRCKWERPKRQK